VAYFDETIAPCGASCDRCRGTTFTAALGAVAPARRGRGGATIAASPARAGARAGGGLGARAGGPLGVPAGGGLGALAAPPDDGLFQRLRVLRRALADAEGVPAYIVFSDAVLARMAAARPSDEAGLLAVSGVGPAKLARYGAEFLRVLREG
jgi:superfamily II DNA helicase RecQ